MGMTKAIEATALRLNAKAADAAALAPAIEKRALTPGPDDVVVEIKAAGINPSDVKAATGLMPYAVFPRTPGRDFAGVIDLHSRAVTLFDPKAHGNEMATAVTMTLDEAIACGRLTPQRVADLNDELELLAGAGDTK